MNEWLNMGVTVSGRWPKEDYHISFGGHAFLLKPETETTQYSVHVELDGLTSDEGRTLMNRFLSVLSWCTREPLKLRLGWSARGGPQPVSRDGRFVDTTPFLFDRELPSNDKARLALALVREGCTANSIPYSFLSYFKVLNIFWKDGPAITKGIQATLPTLKTPDAKRRLESLASQQPDVPKYLYESGRCAIAHSHVDPIIDPDDASDLERLSNDLCIVEEIARHLITSELGLSTSMVE